MVVNFMNGLFEEDDTGSGFASSVRDIFGV